jgi:hypothetical protein
MQGFGQRCISLSEWNFQSLSLAHFDALHRRVVAAFDETE